MESIFLQLEISGGKKSKRKYVEAEEIFVFGQTHVSHVERK